MAGWRIWSLCIADNNSVLGSGGGLENRIPGQSLNAMLLLDRDRQEKSWGP
jgi:hypothetical protein